MHSTHHCLPFHHCRCLHWRDSSGGASAKPLPRHESPLLIILFWNQMPTIFLCQKHDDTSYWGLCPGPACHRWKWIVTLTRKQGKLTLVGFNIKWTHIRCYLLHKILLNSLRKLNLETARLFLRKADARLPPTTFAGGAKGPGPHICISRHPHKTNIKLSYLDQNLLSIPFDFEK